MIKGIAHAAFIVSDMEKSLDFYCNVLGFTHVFEIKDDQQNPWIHYIKLAEGQFIELFYGSPQNTDNHTYSHLCFEVDDIDEIANRIKSRGITLDVEPCQGKDLNYQCWVRDPDGNRIEFMQIHLDSPQNKCRA
ncbi:MAG: VOC family protein [Bacillota bacterium]